MTASCTLNFEVITDLGVFFNIYSMYNAGERSEPGKKYDNKRKPL